MNDDLNEKARLSLHKKLMPYVALVVLLSLSVWAWRHFETMSREREERRFGEYVDVTVAGITERLARYKMILQGGSGLFAASEEVTREEWHTYYEHWEMEALYAGVQAVGFAMVIQPAELERHVEEIRAWGFPEYGVRPAGERGLYTAIVFMEPFEGFNRRALGYDMFSEPVQRDAMERAGDTGRAAMSGRATMIPQEGEESRSGLLIYVPVYAKGIPLNTLEERRAAVQGYVFGLFRVEELIGSLFPVLNPRIGFCLYDGTEVSPQALMFDSSAFLEGPNAKPAPMFTTRKTLDLYARPWTLVFETTPAFEDAVDSLYPKIILVVGVLISMLIFLFKTLEGVGGRALSLARGMTTALRESEERYRILMENSLDVIWTTDLEGRLTFASPSIENLTGYTPDEIMSMPVTQYMVEEDYEAIMARLAGELAKPPTERGRSEIIEARYKTRDGSQVHAEFNAKWLHDKQGNLAGIQGSTRDITGRKQLEKQLNQAQRMESVGRLAGGVAHDFNNMLTVIQGNAELAMMRVKPDDPLRRDLEEIRGAAKRSMEITRQLLAFARKQTIRPQVLDLNETVEGMLKMLRRLIGEDIDLAWLPGKTLWPVQMDPSQIDQLLANLLVNARDAISGVGKITIESENVTLDEAYCADHQGFVPGDFALLAVSDDGHGMDKDILDNIFEPFFTTKEEGKGTGLGLATVYGIVKQNNGFIKVYSEPGKGTTFRIYLPRHAGGPVEADRKGPVSIPMGQGETILVVEDEVSMVNLVKRMLEGLGYAVLEAATPGQAMNVVEEKRGEIHLLMTDVVMPEMNGRDLADRILSRYPHIKVLFMSGYTTNVIAYHGVLEKGVHFMQKPFSLPDLAVRVHEALESEQ